MKGKYIFYITLLLALVIYSCKNNEWEDHFVVNEKTVNKNVWEAVQEDTSLSVFAALIKIYSFDTLFVKDKILTLFIPNNTAMETFIDSSGTGKALLNYCISESYIQSNSVYGNRKIQTLDEKFALFTHLGSAPEFDGITLRFESPLYNNGKYFIMDEVAYPKLNLYEYFARTNIILKDYIDSQDSLILDKEKSRPLGYDSLGNTIYDTVAIKYNKFEDEFFPVSEESRFKTATIVFPKAEDYNNALTQMAVGLNISYVDYKDIPLVWQKKILLPYLLEHGVFENMLEPSEFVLNPAKDDTLKLKNILNDSIVIDYKVGEKVLCSNGYAYNYQNFKIPDTLWNTRYRFEAEKLVRNVNDNVWAWHKGIEVTSTSTFAPKKSIDPVYASEDTAILVQFTSSYTGAYSVQFNVDNLFPKKYLAVVRTNSKYGGKYSIYVNDKLVKTIDYSTFAKGFYDSPDSKIRYIRDAGKLFISFDFYITNLTQYGDAKIKFVYTGPSTGVSFRGFSLDYIDFIPQK